MMEDEKLVLPEDTVELYILNRLYTAGEFYNVIANNYKKEYFENKNVSVLLGVLINFYKKYNNMPTPDILQNIITHIATEHNTFNETEISLTLKNSLKLDVGNDEFIKDQILRYLKSRAIYTVIMSELEYIEETRSVDNCIERFSEITKIGFDDDIGMDYFEDINKHLDYLKNPEAKIKLGYKELDRAFNGGIPAEGRALIVWAGRANIGKSLFLSNTAVNLIEQGLNVVVISLEMSEDMYATRFDAHISDININELSHHTDDVSDRVTQFGHKSGGKLWIKEYPPNTISANTVKNYIEKLQINGNEIDIIIVDYINLLQPNSKKDAVASNSYHRVGTICKELRALSYYFNSTVLSVTQFNRQAVGLTQLDQSMISESDQLNATVDALIGIYQEEGDMEKGIIRNTIMKSRFGMIGNSINYNIDYSTLRITDFVGEDTGGDGGIGADVSLESFTNELLDEL
jgi:KaiC/GvpD/RAD55 family RecA-like ATPase